MNVSLWISFVLNIKAYKCANIGTFYVVGCKQKLTWINQQTFPLRFYAVLNLIT